MLLVSLKFDRAAACDALNDDVLRTVWEYPSCVLPALMRAGKGVAHMHLSRLMAEAVMVLVVSL